MNEISTDQYERKLRELIDNRMAAGRVLANTYVAVTELRTELAAHERVLADARTDAIRAGWTDTELRRVFRDLDTGSPRRTRPPRTPRARGGEHATPAPHAQDAVLEIAPPGRN